MSEELLMKAEGVKDCVKWIKEELKKQKEIVEREKELVRAYGYFSDCGDSYRNSLMRAETKFKTMIETKVSLEKYMKKLKHMANECD